MEKRQEENLSAILEYSFDFDRYMEERLREIEDLDERKFAKNLLLEGLGRVIKNMEKKYKDLERRVYEEIQIADNQYETAMTIVRRDNYDPTNITLFPVIGEDLKEGNLREQLSDKSLVFVETIFLEMDAEGCRNFGQTCGFDGTLTTGNEDAKASFTVRPAKRYRDAMEQLYLIFQDNHIPWETVNTAYLDKFFDVFVSVDAQSTDKAFSKTLSKDAKIQFGIFKDFIQYGIIPLWNLKWVTFESAGFMLPCINGIYYEHEFPLNDKDKNDGYLIQSNEDILEIRHEKEKIILKSQKETFVGWKALQMIQEKTIRSLDYNAPFLTNCKNDTFFRRFSDNSRVNLMTKTDLFRRIMELDIREYIEVIEYEICETGSGYPAVEGMNWFVRDELFPMESRKVLLLKFKEKKPGFYLNDSMVCFAISQIQTEISEYRCVGVII